MIRCLVVAALFVSATSVCLAAVSDDPEPIKDTGANAETIEEVKTTYTWYGYQCATYSTPCKAGGARDPAKPGQYRGCAAPACTGSCTWCGGATTGTSSACIPSSASNNCVLDAVANGSFKCGASMATPCFSATTPPAGEPYPTPDGCYCTIPTTTPTGSICLMLNCS